MKMTKTLAIALEAVGCCVIVGGIAIEVSMGADIGYIVMRNLAAELSFKLRHRNLTWGSG